MPLPVRRTGNPMLNDKTFGEPAAGRDRGRGDDPQRDDRQVVPAAHRAHGGRALALVADGGRGRPGGLGHHHARRLRRLHPRHDRQFQADHRHRYLAIPYAALEGLFLGGISAVLEQRYHGIAIQAVGLTFGVLARAADRLPDAPDQGHGSVPGHGGRRHLRHHAFLPRDHRFSASSISRCRRSSRPPRSASAFRW